MQIPVMTKLHSLQCKCLDCRKPAVIRPILIFTQFTLLRTKDKHIVLFLKRHQLLGFWRGHDSKSTDVFATTVNQKHTLVIVGENQRRNNRFSFVILLFLLHFKIHSVKRAQTHVNGEWKYLSYGLLKMYGRRKRNTIECIICSN